DYYCQVYDAGAIVLF
nr:immunoglobulin light chain junction region [Macaca mulatta]MOW30912.1 immunoglobulin light chain junction region [Macaca mulatta]